MERLMKRVLLIAFSIFLIFFIGWIQKVVNEPTKEELIINHNHRKAIGY